MFSLLVALTMYLVLQPVQPALSVRDFRPQLQHSTLPLAAAVKKQPSSPVKKDPNRLGVETNSKAAALIDWRSGATLFEKNADAPLPIASITKLMTAIVALSKDPDQSEPIEMLGSDLRQGNIPYLAPGEKVTMSDLLHLTLIASDNNAAVALARATGDSQADFVSDMNEKAKELGMKNAVFVDPSGLDPDNVASARDVAALIRHALTVPEISDIVTKRSYSFTALTGRAHSVRSTDELLGSFLSKPPYAFLGGKTGFLDEAGYCFGAAAQNDGNKVIAVVLGADSKEERFRQAKSLMYWAFDAFEWPQPLP